MTKKNAKSNNGDAAISRRSALKGAGLLAGAAAAGVGGASLPTPFTPTALAHTGGAAGRPIKLGLQLHRTGIGAGYGRWYERTTTAAIKLINSMGGIAGRPIELIIEDDGTDPKRGAEVVEKLATKHGVDFIFGTLFSHVVIGSAPRAAELKIPYFVVSEGYHVASGKMNRYCFQPGITDVRSQISSIASWVFGNLGKKVAMIYPDYAFGYNHRDYFSAAAKKHGGNVTTLLPIPPTESSYTKYFAKIPADTDVIYHVMVGPGVLTFVKEMGEHFGSKRPQIFGFMDSLETVDMATPGLEYLDGTYFWEAMPRYAGGIDSDAERFFRAAVGVNDAGASIKNPKEVSTYSHMFGCWETLFFIKEAVEASGYMERNPANVKSLVEAAESFKWLNAGIQRPQGEKSFNGKTHQAYGSQFISKVANNKLSVVHKTSIEDGLYEAEADYTKQPL